MPPTAMPASDQPHCFSGAGVPDPAAAPRRSERDRAAVPSRRLSLSRARAGNGCNDCQREVLGAGADDAPRVLRHTVDIHSRRERRMVSPAPAARGYHVAAHQRRIRPRADPGLVQRPAEERRVSPVHEQEVLSLFLGQMAVERCVYSTRSWKAPLCDTDVEPSTMPAAIRQSKRHPAQEEKVPQFHAVSQSPCGCPRSKREPGWHHRREWPCRDDGCRMDDTRLPGGQ
ncbi:hypothetical protein LZ30DRAFT_304194 [Colletotrichum cereale]|nr:hypothetical protein LZ30DRAFT_304194 [Colletotrichum cereale]